MCIRDRLQADGQSAFVRWQSRKNLDQTKLTTGLNFIEAGWLVCHQVIMPKKNLWTKLIQPDTDNSNFRTLASSVERASTVTFPDVESLRKRNWRDENQYSYG